MLAIEKERRLRLGVALHGCRLFIPVIIAGKFDDLPTEVCDGCHYLDYTAQAIQADFNIGNDPVMSAQLYKIAEYIKTLCDTMKTQPDLFGHCDEYVFPTDEAGER